MRHLLFFTVVISFTVITAEKRYSGYQVYTVRKASNDTQYQALVELQRRSTSLDFWSDPSHNRPTDIMVPPTEVENVVTYLQTNGLEYDVAIKDVQGAVEKEKSSRSNRQSGMNWKEYQRLNIIHAWMDALSIHNPSLAQVSSIGKSTEGRELKILKLSNPAKRNPVIFIDGGIHARVYEVGPIFSLVFKFIEWISPAVVTYIIGRLMSATDPQDRQLVQDIDWIFLPVVNPDGYEFTFNEDRLWRKSRSRLNGDCIGADLNRNFDFHWGEAGVKEDPCANTYPGPFAFSEPESNATAAFLFANRDRIRAYLTFHSYSQLWLTPYGYTEDLPEDYDDLQELGLKATKALEDVHGTEYEVGAPSHILYLYSGSSQDWTREFVNVKHSYTVELRDDGDKKFLLPEDEILPTCEETFAAVQVVARHIIESHKNPNSDSFTPGIDDSDDIQDPEQGNDTDEDDDDDRSK